MRLGFKRFKIGKQEYCATLHQYTDYFKFRDWGRFYLFPTVVFNISCSGNEIGFYFMFWGFEIENETNQNMGCIKE